MQDLENESEKAVEENKQPSEHLNFLEDVTIWTNCSGNLRNHGRPIHEVGKCQGNRKKKEVKTRAAMALWFLESFGLTLESVKVKDKDEKATELGYGKDNGTSFHDHRSDLNKIFHISKTPGKNAGAQMSFKEELRVQIKKKRENGDLEKQEVNVSGDGAKMSRITNFIVISFALLSDGEKVMSCKDLLAEINELVNEGEIEVDGHKEKNILNNAIEKDKKDNLSKAPSARKHKNMQKTIEAINSCGVSFTVWEKCNADGTPSGLYDWTSMVGNEKKKVLRSLPEKFPQILDPEQCDSITKLWKGFDNVYQTLSAWKPSQNRIDSFFKDCIEPESSLKEISFSREIHRFTLSMEIKVIPPALRKGGKTEEVFFVVKFVSRVFRFNPSISP
ncbi:hypothetical protein AWC38_SpisGene2134 [Stylophora pistillata]|uniref:Uncharacterized protein n=1 Tax=Stylophora pistillata TaxID=50429 RepID=A0A2B4SXF4_STYPI|nr:hypothetical protein AWC38_SpisGene2134 [Stylophora pistillata]